MAATPDIRAGRLRHRVTIQAPSEALDAYGQPVASWVDVATVWADVRPRAGRESVDADQTRAAVTHAVTIRYPGTSQTLSPRHRLLFRGRALGLTQVLNIDERNRRLELLCEELP